MAVYNGNRRDNVLNGSNRNDFMNGKEGNDTLYGNGGDDNLHGGTGNDRLEGGDGNDNLYGEDGTDTLLGGAGTDLLNGGSGNDTLDGGIGNDQVYGHLGADQLTGGLGADNFVYTSNLESSLASGVDRIRDYDPLTDAIQLGGDTAWVDANTSLAGTQQWQYVGDTRLAGELANGNGQATLSYSGGVTTLTLYRYGSSDAYMTLEFDGQFQPGEIDLIATQLPTYPWHVVAW